MLNEINFHHLYYFFVIATEGQVARAAKRLRIGQPTLSTQLRQFEELLGVRLFDRKRGQALALTPHGEILLEYSRRIFELSEEMLASVRGLRPDLACNLRLGALDWLPKKEVHDLMASARKRFGCFISVVEDTSTALLEMLERNRVDLVVANAPPPHVDSVHFRAHRIASLPVTVCGAPRFATLRKGFPESLAGQPMILPTHHGRTRHAIDDFFRGLGIEVRVVGEVQDGELLRRWALSGEALAPLSPSTVDAEIRSGQLLTIGSLDDVREEIWLLSKPRKVEHPVVEFLMTSYRSPGVAQIEAA